MNDNTTDKGNLVPVELEMASKSTWTPPSIKSIESGKAKLPTIEILGENGNQRYLEWINENKTIPRTIPPIFTDFIIKYTRTFEKRIYQYMEIVHYSDDLAELDICHIVGKKKILMAHSRYIDYESDTVKAGIYAPPSAQYEKEWTKMEGVAALYTVLAVQAYILYHRPEEIPIEVTANPKKSQKTKKDRHSPKRQLGKDVIYKRIVLNSEEQLSTSRNYRAIQWSVRGHYRRLKKPDGTGYMTYVKPHIAKRAKNMSEEMELLMNDTPQFFMNGDDT